MVEIKIAQCSICGEEFEGRFCVERAEEHEKTPIVESKFKKGDFILELPGMILSINIGVIEKVGIDREHKPVYDNGFHTEERGILLKPNPDNVISEYDLFHSPDYANLRERILQLGIYSILQNIEYDDSLDLKTNRLNFKDKKIKITTQEDVRNMNPDEFRKWGCELLSGISVGCDDIIIDGLVHIPPSNPEYHGSLIRLKQSDNVGGNVITHFIDTMKEMMKNDGFIIAFSFTKVGKKQVENFNRSGQSKIHLLTVKDIVGKDFEEIIDNLEIVGKITLEDIENMETHEFQKWVCKCLSATSVEPNSQSNGTIFDKVIDFPSFEQFNGALIRMEQHASVGEPIIKATREKMIVAEKSTAFIIAPSFTESAKELVSEFKKYKKANIYLVTLESIMNKNPEEIFETIDCSDSIKQRCGELYEFQ